MPWQCVPNYTNPPDKNDKLPDIPRSVWAQSVRLRGLSPRQLSAKITRGPSKAGALNGVLPSAGVRSLSKLGGEGQDRTDDLRVMNPALLPTELHHLGVSDGDRTHAYRNHNPRPYHLATDTINHIETLSASSYL